jgi:hypothetical protein
MLPEHMRDGARRYIEDRILPGGFMTAVLENNLVDAYQKADTVNLARMKDWVMWLYWECPRAAWGSPLRVKTWLISEEGL